MQKWVILLSEENMTVSNSTEKQVPLWQRIIIGRRPVVTLIRMVILVVLILAIYQFALIPVRITGISMEPTCHDHHVGLVNRLSYFSHEPERSDIIAIKTTGVRIMYLKRIIGLPGETLSISNGVVYINGDPLSEPYVVHRMPWNLPPVQLASNEYFVIGDNRGMPQEQHDFGRAFRNQIVGKKL